MKSIIITVLLLFSGVMGMIFFFGDCSDLTLFILSKPLGIMLLYSFFRLHKRFKSKKQSTIIQTH